MPHSGREWRRGEDEGRRRGKRRDSTKGNTKEAQTHMYMHTYIQHTDNITCLCAFTYYCKHLHTHIPSAHIYTSTHTRALGIM